MKKKAKLQSYRGTPLGCPFLRFISNPPCWLYAFNFYVDGKDACERQVCPNVKCHNRGKRYNDPRRLRAQFIAMQEVQ